MYVLVLVILVVNTCKYYHLIESFLKHSSVSLVVQYQLTVKGRKMYYWAQTLSIFITFMFVLEV